MPTDKPHDLYDFMQQLQDRMAAHYKQIQKRASEDPGTAGDQGEENWADLLRGWLPRTYEVVTKGRIIGQDGRVSPQVDVLVLKSIYPKQLIDEGQKIFLAAGVAAAFECKTTLKAEHIEKAVKTCVEVKNLYPVRKGTPYKELHAPIVYGLLAHSHSWKGKNSTPEENIEQKLFESHKSDISHPRLALDLLCVANLATWIWTKMTLAGQNWPPDSLLTERFIPHGNSKHSHPVSDGMMLGLYNGYKNSYNDQTENFAPISSLILGLWQQIAWETPELRDFVDYWQATKVAGKNQGNGTLWPLSIYSEMVQKKIKLGALTNNDWNEWNLMFPINLEMPYTQ